MEQKVPFGPSRARAKWDFLLHLEKRPDPRRAARAGKRSAPTPGRAGPANHDHPHSGWFALRV